VTGIEFRRFRREAEVLASLNHPNIAAIYNLEESGGVRFLVLAFITGKPRIWFSSPLANLGLTANFDLAPDGKRVVAVLPAGDEEQPKARTHTTLVLNFFGELQRRVPTGK